jgi:energy-converting hydrogenase Eha subunit F
MITQALFSFFLALIGIIISLLPGFNLDVSTFTANMTPVFELLAKINYFFPITALVTAIGILVSWELFKVGFHLFNWIIKKIPGIS